MIDIKIYNKPAFGKPNRAIIFQLTENYLKQLESNNLIVLSNLMSLSENRYKFAEKKLFWFLFDTNKKLREKVKDCWNFCERESVGLELLAKPVKLNSHYYIINNYCLKDSVQ